MKARLQMSQKLTRRLLIGCCLGLGAVATALTAYEGAHAAGADRVAGSAGMSTAAIEKKLDQILANQQTILLRFDAVMEELRIIKVRATR